MISLMKSHSLASIFSSSLIDLPSPSNLTSMWNFGSLLGLCLGFQILTGLLLAMHYSCDTSMAFSSVSHIMRDVNLGWIMRITHANGASLFFICIYIHLARGIYFNSFILTETWVAGVTILLLIMATAFLGYVLPWGQMSFWGATVITSLFSAIPVIGGDVVSWLWGGFAVDNATLTRFFALHFILPFMMTAVVMIHLIFLHQSGSLNPLGLGVDSDKIPFHPYYSTKDMVGILLGMMMLMLLSLINPWAFGDPENFSPANPLVTPIHIQPEWYFLFAYAILRSIPNKLGGVVALALAVMVLYTMPFRLRPRIQNHLFSKWRLITFVWFWTIVGVLTWIGARPVEPPYILIGQIYSFLYFEYILVSPVSSMSLEIKHLMKTP